MASVTRHQKLVLSLLGSAVAVLSVVVILLSVGGDGGGRGAAGTSSSTSSSTTETTSTTLDLAPVEPSTTLAPRKPTTTSPPTTAAPQPVVTGAGAVLMAPKVAETRIMSGSDCRSLAVGGPGWSADCGQLGAKGGVDLVWLVERRTSPAGTRSAVLRRTGPSQWTVILAADDPGGVRFTAVSVAVADASGDGKLDIGFGFRLPDSADTLAVDVVEGPGQVVVHQNLAHGSARISSGQLNTWATAPDDSSQVVKQVIRFVSGAWRVTATSREPAPAPTSQL